LHTRYKELPRNKEIAVICLTGSRSPTAVRFLLSKGFPTVFSVDGGVQKWVAEKRPIIRNIGG
jgi:rhodanese-related sulfurtransferase